MTRTGRSVALLRPAALVAFGAALVGAYAMTLWRAPGLLVDQGLLAAATTGERLSAEHNARLTVISLGGALVVATGLLYTARNFRLAQRGQVTDRFTKALERLGSDELYVRIGGVHALEHVMRDSPDHHADVVEVLVAFVRSRAPRRADEQAADDRWMHPPAAYPPPSPREPAADVQAALTALGRRPKRRARERGRLDLSGLHLERAQLSGAWLERANFSGAQLDAADLSWARLTGAHLTGTRLRAADLAEARLEGAELTGARLEDANLSGARLRGSSLAAARFDGADLSWAQLPAYVQPEQLRGVKSTGARFSGPLAREQLRDHEPSEDTG